MTASISNNASTVPVTGIQLAPVNVRGETDLQTAVEKWRVLLGAEHVLSAEQAACRYGASTCGVQRQIPLALRPANAEQVQQIVKIASIHRVPLYPISTGRNWGYGSANPTTDHNVILDLSQLNRIIDCDGEAGIVTVEPGVTQQQLRDYLDTHNLPFFVPVHGGGPDCSLLGNALERGYGITPHADHFAAVNSLQAVLPDGRLYRSALSEWHASEVDRLFKWGLGPYLDGIFSQGNFGVVTQATIALAPRAEHTEAFFFSFGREDSIVDAVAAVQATLRSLGNLASSINLMNMPRVLSMTAPYPTKRVGSGEAMSRDLLLEMGAQYDIQPWTGVGALYGPRQVVKAAGKVVRKQLGPLAKRLVFLNQRNLTRFEMVASWWPGKPTNVHRQLKAARQYIGLAEGRPQRIALPLAYWKSGREVDTNETLNPAEDRCGLTWYSPLVPMKGRQVRDYVEMVTRVCPQHGLDPLITLTSLSDRLFDSTVPLLFQHEGDEPERAEACYQQLLQEGQAMGCVPYRLGVRHMQQAVQADKVCWELAGQIKQAIDPHNLIAPGRYNLGG